VRIAVVTVRGNDVFSQKVLIILVLVAFGSPYISKIKILINKIQSMKSQGSAAFHAVGVSSPCRCQQAWCHTVFTSWCTTRLETRLARNCNENVKISVTHEVCSGSSWSIRAASL
jgi:hypothetical protein